jgi:hypothetical protein
LARADIWRWSTGGLSVPALYYYDGGTLAALTNSADDFFEGATTDISTLQAAISANRPTFDYSLAQTVRTASTATRTWAVRPTPGSAAALAASRR